jgi:hypothetical protein
VTWHLAGLWRKELQQQRWTLLGTTLLLAFSAAVTAGAYRRDPAATQPMLIVAQMLQWFVPLVGLTQAQAMVVREYSAKTQFFVEALPLRRLGDAAGQVHVGAGDAGCNGAGSLALGGRRLGRA